MSDILKTLPRAADNSGGPSIWWWAFGYFACYVPYTALTKMLSQPLVAVGGEGGVNGLELLPPTAIASTITSYAFLFGSGLWRHAVKRPIAGLPIPTPSRLTFLSGLGAAGIISTTTLAYTFGASAVLLALLMRGGVLIIAPIVDAVTRRTVRWFSWAALALSLIALAISVKSGDTRMTVLATVDVACYLGFYFIRLSLMSRKAKSKDLATNRRYFVEEMLVSTPALVAILAIGAVVAGGRTGALLEAGFTTFFDRPVVGYAITIGVLSQGTGIFGGLIFLDQRENTFTVPVNRASSVLAVLAASIYLSTAFAVYPPVPGRELASAGLILVSIAFLTLGPILDRRRAGR